MCCRMRFCCRSRHSNCRQPAGSCVKLLQSAHPSLHERTYAACSNANDTHKSAKPDLGGAAYDCLLERPGSSAAPSTCCSSSRAMHRGGIHGTASLLACLAVVATLGGAHGARRLLASDNTGVVGPWGKCGGQTCINGSATCSDSASLSCSTGYACQRLHQWYWQCRPATESGSSSSTAPTGLPTVHTSPSPRAYSPGSASSPLGLPTAHHTPSSKTYSPIATSSPNHSRPPSPPRHSASPHAAAASDSGSSSDDGEENQFFSADYPPSVAKVAASDASTAVYQSPPATAVPPSLKAGSPVSVSSRTRTRSPPPFHYSPSTPSTESDSDYIPTYASSPDQQSPPAVHATKTRSSPSPTSKSVHHSPPAVHSKSSSPSPTPRSVHHYPPPVYSKSSSPSPTSKSHRYSPPAVYATKTRSSPSPTANSVHYSPPPVDSKSSTPPPPYTPTRSQRPTPAFRDTASAPVPSYVPPPRVHKPAAASFPSSSPPTRYTSSSASATALTPIGLRVPSQADPPRVSKSASPPYESTHSSPDYNSDVYSPTPTRTRPAASGPVGPPFPDSSSVPIRVTTPASAPSDTLGSAFNSAAVPAPAPSASDALTTTHVGPPFPDTSSVPITVTAPASAPSDTLGSAFNSAVAPSTILASANSATHATASAEVPPVLEYGIAYPPKGSVLPDDITSRLACAKAYTFVSYLDRSGIDAPDGTYKETCEDISYDCNTDVITATCYNKQGAGEYRTSSLSQASTCSGDIATSYGHLSCISTATPSPAISTRQYAAAPASCPYYKFVSKLDGSGIEAPEGSYKETCSVIKYDCSTDTITARCVGSTGQSVMTSLADASECHDSITGHAGSIANINGELECQS